MIPATSKENPVTADNLSPIPGDHGWFLNFALIVPNSPPVANAGPDQILSANSSCEASVTLDGSGSSDPDGDSLTYSWTEPFSPPPVSGVSPTVTFPKGNANATLTVNDGKGGTDSDTVMITVQDTTLPEIICPSDITVNNDPGTSSASVTYTAPTGTDNCPGVDTTQTVGLGSGATFPIGTTTNTFVVTDAAGNTASCSFTVTVNDTENPTAVCQDITVQLDAGGNTSITAQQVDNGSSDACGISSLNVNPNTFTCANVGPNTVTLTVTDKNGNSSTCNATVKVEDNVLPIIQCNAPATITPPSAPISFTATATDNCGIASLEIISFDCFKFTKKGKADRQDGIMPGSGERCYYHYSGFRRRRRSH